ncbi:hypothetical protein [Leptospira bandrabouensis]|uniref:Uncharacterized protein n=1 Tax=Leptospira bandrabouensis TaxID=2484903 RepID=A0A6H3NVV2_9LEPT|nr:hypothetical protein [Leptospira bandrabouensis]TGN13485.1 hypothetical protein EHR08_11555 [Leptospira bandrabouensis]
MDEAELKSHNFQKMISLLESVDSAILKKVSDVVSSLPIDEIDIESGVKENIISVFGNKDGSFILNELKDITSEISELSDLFSEKLENVLERFLSTLFIDFEQSRIAEITKMLIPLTIGCPPIINEVRYQKVKNFSNSNFIGCKIVTSIRPVFGVSEEISEENIVTQIITHELLLRYYKNGKSKDFYVTLDEHDLEVISRTIERAKKKNTSLMRLFNAD